MADLPCAQKRRYGDLRSVAQAIYYRQLSIKCRLWHYLCPHCGGFHLTKRPKKGAKARTHRRRMLRAWKGPNLMAPASPPSDGCRGHDSKPAR